MNFGLQQSQRLFRVLLQKNGSLHDGVCRSTSRKLTGTSWSWTKRTKSEGVGSWKSSTLAVPGPNQVLGRRWMSGQAVGESEASKIRNVAIVAHVDHGKTTLVDALLEYTAAGDTTLNDRAMDSNDLEKERGITILSKSTSLKYKDTTINVVDTPGHSDFSGEVERVMSMVDGVVLVVDATDGPMPQTKYVLSKALEQNLIPLVVVNKVDRPTARIHEVNDEVFDLFCQLDANDDQLEYVTVYGSGKLGWCQLEEEIPKDADSVEKDMSPLLETIVSSIPGPKVEKEEEMRMLISIMESDEKVHLGNLLLTGRILSGTVKKGMQIKKIDPEGQVTEKPMSVVNIYKRIGTERFEIPSAVAGDIVTLAGVNGRVGDTLCDPSVVDKGPVDGPKLDPATVSMVFMVNDSKLAGHKEWSGGSKLTSVLLKERLYKETESNIAIQVQDSQSSEGKEGVEVFGRGEMQLAVLIETMRREGFEFAVSPPKALIKVIDGVKMEPFEVVSIDADEKYAGMIVESLLGRKGELLDSVSHDDGKRQKATFRMPSRGMTGLRSEMIRETRGDVIINAIYDGYDKHVGIIGESRKGVLIASHDGTATQYALQSLESRGELFISPGAQVYAGQIVGQSTRDEEMDINVAKTKKLTNIRAAGKDEQIRLSPPRKFTLEEYLGYVSDDELIEITPNEIRIRKSILDQSKRRALSRSSKKKK